MKKQFTELTKEEMMNINGSIFGVDDAIFWKLVATGFSAGVAVGINRINRKHKHK